MTDGTFKYIDRSYRMEIGIVFHPSSTTTVLDFSVRYYNYLSPTSTELVAITILLQISPDNTTLHIYADFSFAIYSIKSFVKIYQKTKNISQKTHYLIQYSF